VSIASLHPLFKLGLGAALVVAGSATIQSAAWAVGLDFNILQAGNGGRGMLLAVGIAALLFLMSSDRRPIADYGLAVGPDWKRRLLTGIVLGVGTYTAYILVCWLSGGCDLQPQAVPAKRWLSAFLSALPSVLLAATQQFIFSGYILSILKDRFWPVVAVVLSAALFAVMHQIDDLGGLAQPDSRQLLLGLFLAAALLALLRLKTGEILTSSGLLGGWLIARRMLRTGIIAPLADSPSYEWLLPGNDPRQAPVLIAILAAASLTTLWLVWRHGEGRPAAAPLGVDANFKRVFPLSHMNGLAPLDVWLPLLVRARFQVGLKYIPRLLAVLVLSTVNTILTLPERLVLLLILRRRDVRGPIFVVGTHRSGTTHLHNLLALDPQFCTARAYQVMNPAGCVLTGWLMAPLLSLFMPWKRPMDGVRFSMFSPQEEEFGIAGLCRLSPCWGMTFPRDWPDFDRYIFPDRLPDTERLAWQNQYRSLLQKLTLWTRNRLLLKNPYNTARVAILREMFPGAQFIHISRHPHVVYRSNLHLAREGHVCNQLHDPDEDNSYETRFLGNYRAMEDSFAEDARDLPGRTVARVRFEDLEREPLAAIERIYDQLGMTISTEFRRRLATYLEGLAGYEKNRHKPLALEDQARIAAAMSPFMYRHGYFDEAPAARRRAA
jgi:membrane protease YdiL (CAAX protease family)